MNVRTKFSLSFFGICLVFVSVMYLTVLQLPHVPIVRWAILTEGLAYLAVAIGIFQMSLKRLPPAPRHQKSTAARSVRRAAWLFFAVPVVAFLARGQDLTALPYGLGLVLPLLPIVIGVYFLRLSMKLGRASAEAGVDLRTER